MNIRKRLKRKIRVERQESIEDSANRKQFNMEINKKSITSVHALATIFRVPRYALTEHALDIGISHLLKVTKDDKRLKLWKSTSLAGTFWTSPVMTKRK